MSQAKPFPNLMTPRLFLDEILATDKQQVFEIFSDPVVTQHYDVERFTQVGQAANLIDYFKARFEGHTGMRWAIRESAGGPLIGSCGFNTWNEYDYSAVLGYELKPQYWGKGYAREAVARILSFIFSDDFSFYVNRIEALILPQNKASSNLASKLGFINEGCLRGKCYWNDGFHDMCMFGLLRQDWLKLSQEEK